MAKNVYLGISGLNKKLNMLAKPHDYDKDDHIMTLIYLTHEATVKEWLSPTSPMIRITTN